MPAKTLADVAYERVRGICLGFPAAEEKLSHGAPSFHVRGKMFLMFVDGHHDDTRVAVWCKAAPEEQRRLVASDPARYFVPPYVGVKGWVGVRLDGADPGWIDLSIVVEEGWRSVAPSRVARGEDVPPPRKKLPPPTRVTTDPALVKALHARFRDVCLALPGAEIEEDGWHATFRAKKRPFAYFVDNHHGDGMIGGWVRGDKRANAKLVAAEPERYFIPQHIGARGWIGMRLDLRKVDWTLIAERVAASHAMVAPPVAPRRTPGRKQAPAKH